MNSFAALVPELAEARLQGFTWRRGGRDLELVATLASGRTVTFTCGAVTDLSIELRFRKQAGGAPRACGCDLELLGKGRCLVEWAFPPQGFLAFECDAASIGADAQLQT
jgi:hypothetical protein